MPKKTQHSKHRQFWTACLTTLAVAMVGLVTYILIHHYYFEPAAVTTTNTNSKYTTSPAPRADNTENNVRKTGSSTTSTLNNDSIGSSTSTAPPSSTASYSVQVNPTLVDNGTSIHVGTMVVGSSSGNCTLTASQTGQPTLDLGSSVVKQDVNSFDCGVFNVPTTTFPVNGTWKLTLTVSTGSNSASGSKNITF